MAEESRGIFSFMSGLFSSTLCLWASALVLFIVVVLCSSTPLWVDTKIYCLELYTQNSDYSSLCLLLSLGGVSDGHVFRGKDGSAVDELEGDSAALQVIKTGPPAVWDSLKNEIRVCRTSSVFCLNFLKGKFWDDYWIDGLGRVLMVGDLKDSPVPMGLCTPHSHFMGT